jgi:hypothetical protein
LEIRRIPVEEAALSVTIYLHGGDWWEGRGWFIFLRLLKNASTITGNLGNQ